MGVFKSNLPECSIPEISFSEFVFQQFSNKYGEKAIIDTSSENSLTYEQIEQLSYNLATNLIAKFGVAKGDVLAIYLPNNIYYPVIGHGINLAGGVVTTISPMSSENEVTKQCADCEPNILFTIPLFLPNAVVAAKNGTVKKLIVLTQEKPEDSDNIVQFSTLLEAPKEIIKATINPKEDVAFMPYSSGTTGNSKAVLLTHYNLVSSISQICSIPAGTIVAGILPYSHIFGYVIILNANLRDTCLIINFPRYDLKQFLEATQKYKIDIVSVVPSIINQFANNPLIDEYDTKSIQYMTSGGADLSRETQLKIKKRFGLDVLTGYGMTEMGATATASPPTNSKYGSCGILVPFTELKIIDVNDGVTMKGVGEEGELCFRGPQVMKGYKDVERTKDILKDGWIHTGDLGYIDNDGYIFVVDRIKELIKYNGMQVPPAELESVLMSHEAVADVAVIGVKDEVTGEVPKAFVVKRKEFNNVTAEELMNFVGTKVASFKKVRKIEFVDEIPRNITGKILRKVLKSRQ